VLLITDFYAAAGLTHIRQVASFAGQLVDSPFVVTKGLAADVWFCETCYCVVASERNFGVSVFKQVGDSAYLWGEKGESCPFCVVFFVCVRWWVFCFVLYLSLQFMYHGGWEVVSLGYV